MSAGMLASPLPVEAEGIPRERRFFYSLEKYRQLIAAGGFGPEDRCELIDGDLVRKMPQLRDHNKSVTRTAYWFHRRVEEPWVVGSQGPITLPPHEPEPDVWVARGWPDRDDGSHPGARELPLVIEVAESSLAFDRGRKLRLYAAAGIPEYWIVNLIDRQVEVHRAPVAEEGRYAAIEVVPADGTLKVILDGAEIGALPVAELLP